MREVRWVGFERDLQSEETRGRDRGEKCPVRLSEESNINIFFNCPETQRWKENSVEKCRWCWRERDIQENFGGPQNYWFEKIWLIYKFI